MSNEAPEQNPAPFPEGSLAEIAVTPNIWRPPSVDKEPHVGMTSWSVFEATFPDGTWSHHAVGYCGEGRVTSSIKEFRPDTAEIVTRSGRVYRLTGPSGLNGDASYVWGYWAKVNKVGSVKDVSQDYQDSIDAAETGVD